MRRFAIALACLMVTSMLGAGNAHGAPQPAGRAVVIVSGGDATSPFTTPDQACMSGLAAGNTDTALRQHLLDHGYRAFTSPALAGRGPVVDQAGFGAFGNCPITLPENMTVNSTGSIDTAGEHLARFLTHLHDTYGVREIDVVGHSMGGLYSRAAFRVLQSLGSPIRIRSLTTIGTPWQGSYLSDYANGITSRSDCLGDRFCEVAMDGMKDEVQRLMAGSGREVNQAFLMGPDGWNDYQTGVLDGIPVTLIAGNRFAAPAAGANPTVWPNDGIVAEWSALATDISSRVLPNRRTFTFDDTHSIYVSNEAGLPWETGLTWDPRVLGVVRDAIDAA
ncbi:alpha/beta fold hydrolase [Mycobacterium sp. 236(2023)]|uniref:esterase/lipase family protein n=1 Tax=Mycobacterium sp. 236(2023) TaxID=3038163 RepID=UPI0024150E27|nr:alpha/beta fold hydrolase [Mycobacterium sp. 236(2023)]MDG4664124.1 alpha/beta hydrolase [Mycobacterium sp. 236(2023)]